MVCVVALVRRFGSNCLRTRHQAITRFAHAQTFDCWVLWQTYWFMFTLREDQQPYALHAALRIKRSNIKCCGVTGGTPASQPAGRTIPLAALSYRYRDKHQQIWISPIASKSNLYCRPKSYFSCFAAYEKRPANRGTLWIFWQICNIICQRGIWSNSFVCYVDLLPNI